MSATVNATPSNREVGTRLAMLRKKRKMDQQELADLLSELMDKDKQFSKQTISSWEVGRRFPTSKTLDKLAELYGVTVNYLLCLTDDPYDNDDRDVSEKIAISMKEISIYDGKPVYIEFQNDIRRHQWGIVNSTRQCFVLKDDFLKFTNKDIKRVSISRPEYYDVCSLNGGVPLNMSQLINRGGDFFVKMITSDTFIQGLYNGWYTHNENNTALINSRGLVLPYDGLGVSYYAYTKTQKI